MAAQSMDEVYPWVLDQKKGFEYRECRTVHTYVARVFPRNNSDGQIEFVGLYLVRSGETFELKSCKYPDIDTAKKQVDAALKSAGWAFKDN